MENILGYFKMFILCCLFWISSNAERKIISKVVGSTVKLYCKNESLSSLTQGTWMKNESQLLSFKPSYVHWYHEAYSLQVNISASMDKLYALTIERVQEVHAGNYTCETTTSSGVYEETWMLIITENAHIEVAENKPLLLIIIGTCVGAVLVLVVFFTILQRHCKGHRERNNIPPATGETQRTEDVYENCLERKYCRSEHIYSN